MSRKFLTTSFLVLCAFSGVMAQNLQQSSLFGSIGSSAMKTVSAGGFSYTLPVGSDSLIARQFSVNGRELGFSAFGDVFVSDSGEPVSLGGLPANVPAIEWITAVRGQEIGANALTSNSTMIFPLAGTHSWRVLRAMSKASGRILGELSLSSDHNMAFEVRANDKSIFVVTSFIKHFSVGSLVIEAAEPVFGVSGIMIRIPLDGSGQLAFFHLSGGSEGLSFDLLNLNGGNGQIISGKMGSNIAFVMKARLFLQEMPWFQFVWTPSDTLNVRRLTANKSSVALIGDTKAPEIHVWISSDGSWRDSTFALSPNGGGFIASFDHGMGAFQWMNTVSGNIRLYAGAMTQSALIVAGDIHGHYTIRAQNLGMGSGGPEPTDLRTVQFAFQMDSLGQYLNHRTGMFGSWWSVALNDQSDVLLGGYRRGPNGGVDFSLHGFSKTYGDFSYAETFLGGAESVASITRQADEYAIGISFNGGALKIGDWYYSGGFKQSGYAIVKFAPQAEGLRRGKMVFQTTSVSENNANAPESFSLHQNYPNPFNPSTTIEFNVPRATPASLKIFNLSGQLVREFQIATGEARKMAIVWDATDQSGKALASGMYVYKLEAGSAVLSRSMQLVK